MKKNVFIKSLIVLFLFTLIVAPLAMAKQPEIPTIPKTSLVFTNSHYIDHTYGVIGIKQGWFKEVGIDIQPKPYGRVVAVNEMSAVLAAGTVDVATVYNAIVVGWMNRTTDLLQITYCNLYQGGSIMATAKYKSVQEFLDEGYSFEVAMQKTMAQMKRKRVIFSSDMGQKGLRDLAFEMGKMSEKDVRVTILEDRKLAEFGLAGRAEFVFPGGSEITFQLLQKGWKSIISTRDFTGALEPDPNNPFLLSIGSSGWGVKRQWLEENHDTALRLISVMFRIIDLIQQDPDKAANIQLPFFNSVLGAKLTAKEVKFAYSTTDIFHNFEEQRKFWINKEDALYYEWVSMAHIRNFESDKVLPKGKFKPDDVIVAGSLYKELVALKENYELVIPQVRRLILRGDIANKNLSMASKLLKNALYHYESRNYLDANRFAVAAKEWAKYGLR